MFWPFVCVFVDASFFMWLENRGGTCEDDTCVVLVSVVVRKGCMIIYRDTCAFLIEF